MKKILFLLRAIWQNKLDFSVPPKNDIAIFDACGVEILEKTLLNNLSFTVIYVRNEKIYATLFIILQVFKKIIFDRLTPGLSYYLTLLNYIKPKVVLTLIDNSNSIGNLSSYYDATYISIQNGNRSKSNVALLNYVPTLFCFGKNEIDLYKEENTTIGAAYPVGSLKAGYYREILRKEPKIEYDLCLISAYRPLVFEEGQYPLVKLAYEKLLEYLVKYLAKQNLRFCIAMNLKQPSCSNEESYYSKIFGSKITLVPNDPINFSSYYCADKSHVVIGRCSTLQYEAFGWGKKVFFADFNEDPKVDGPRYFSKPDLDSIEAPDDLLFVTRPSFPIFEQKLDHLFQMPQDEFAKRVEKNRKYVMNYDRDKPAHKIIREYIEKNLSLHAEKASLQMKKSTL
jgi:surface carbohydrate biosynthesis protein